MPRGRRKGRRLPLPGILAVAAGCAAIPDSPPETVDPAAHGDPAVRIHVPESLWEGGEPVLDGKRFTALLHLFEGLGKVRGSWLLLLPESGNGSVPGSLRYSPEDARRWGIDRGPTLWRDGDRLWIRSVAYREATFGSRARGTNGSPPAIVLLEETISRDGIYEVREVRSLEIGDRANRIAFGEK